MRSTEGDETINSEIWFCNDVKNQQKIARFDQTAALGTHVLNVKIKPETPQR